MNATYSLPGPRLASRRDRSPQTTRFARMFDLMDLMAIPPRRKRGRPPADAETLRRRAIAARLADERILQVNEVALLCGVDRRTVNYWREAARQAS